MNIESNYSLKDLNTFGLNISAEYYCEARTPEDILKIATSPELQKLNKLVLGGGSNMLFIKDFSGLVIHNYFLGISEEIKDENQIYITAGGGENWHTFVIHCVNKGYGGLENLSLIPGCVGAAPIQNIGAYGVEIKDTFYKLTAIELSSGISKTFYSDECRFGYRDSIFKNEAKNKFIITSVTFCLSTNPKINISYGAISAQLQTMGVQSPTIKDVSSAVIAIRQSKLPDPKIIGNAGSFFKNPEILSSQFDELKKVHPDIVGYKTTENHVKIAAGWLIENSGWKGKRIGNTGMHEKQALVLVNYGNASGTELIDHAKRVQQSVKEKFDIHLEMEVNIIG